MQLAEFVGPLRGEEVRPARQDLAELDEGRPQRLDGEAHPLRARQPLDADRRLGAPHEMNDVPQPEAVKDLVEAIGEQHARDDLEASTVSRGNEGGLQHGER